MRHTDTQLRLVDSEMTKLFCFLIRAAITAFSIQVLAETWQQSGIFLKKMPSMRNSKRQHMDRKRSSGYL
jgi:hypothetical protein